MLILEVLLCLKSKQGDFTAVFFMLTLKRKRQILLFEDATRFPEGRKSVEIKENSVWIAPISSCLLKIYGREDKTL